MHQLLSVYQRRPRVVMKAALQIDPSVGNRLPNVSIKGHQTESIFTWRSNGWPAAWATTARRSLINQVIRA